MSDTLRFAIHLTAFRRPRSREDRTHRGIESHRTAEGARERALLLRGLETILLWTQIGAPAGSAGPGLDDLPVGSHEPHELVLAALAATADARPLRRRYGDHSLSD